VPYQDKDSSQQQLLDFRQLTMACSSPSSVDVGQRPTTFRQLATGGWWAVQLTVHPRGSPAAGKKKACSETPPPLPVKRASCFSFWLVACHSLCAVDQNPLPHSPSSQREGAQPELWSRAAATALRARRGKKTMAFLQCEAVPRAPERPTAPVARRVPSGPTNPDQTPPPPLAKGAPRPQRARPWRMVATPPDSQTTPPRARPRPPPRPSRKTSASAPLHSGDASREAHGGTHPFLFLLPGRWAPRRRPPSLPSLALATARQNPASRPSGLHPPKHSGGLGVAGRHAPPPTPAVRPHVDAVGPRRVVHARAVGPTAVAVGAVDPRGPPAGPPQRRCRGHSGTGWSSRTPPPDTPGAGSLLGGATRLPTRQVGARHTPSARGAGVATRPTPPHRPASVRAWLLAGAAAAAPGVPPR